MRNRNMGRRRSQESHMCGRHCKELPVMPNNPQLANAYVPYQYADQLLCPNDSLENGTTFPELVSPYAKNQSQCVIQYLMQTETCEEVDPCE